jgi:hypothetical protein
MRTAPKPVGHVRGDGNTKQERHGSDGIDLAERAGLAYPTAHREVGRLVEAGILSERQVGRTRLIRANDESPLVDPLREILTIATGPLVTLADELARIERERVGVLLRLTTSHGPLIAFPQARRFPVSVGAAMPSSHDLRDCGVDLGAVGGVGGARGVGLPRRAPCRVLRGRA